MISTAASRVPASSPVPTITRDAGRAHMMATAMATRARPPQTLRGIAEEYTLT
jgi:hypothetical protein